MPEPMRVSTPSPTSKWRYGLVVTATLIVVLYFAYRLDSVVTPLLVSLLVAYVMNPFVAWMERKGFPRLGVVILVFVSLGVVLGLVTLIVIPATVQQLVELGKWASEKSPQVINQVKAQHSAGFNDLVERARHAVGLKWDDLANYLVKNFTAFLGSTFNVLNLLILIPLYTFFFLWRFDRVIAAIDAHLPREYRPRIVRVVTQIDAVAANFFRGRLICCLFIGVTTAVGFAVLGVPFAWILGLALGVLNLVPYFGPIIGVIPALVIAAIHFQNWQQPAYTFGVFAVLQLLDGFVLSPIVQGKMVGLHPITTIVVLLMGGELAGVFGLILAVPAAAAIKILAREFLLPELEHAPALDRARAGSVPEGTAPVNNVPAALPIKETRDA